MAIKFKNQAKTSKRIGLSGKGGCGKSYAITNLYKKPIVFDLEKKWSAEPPFDKIPTVDIGDSPDYGSVMAGLIDILNQEPDFMSKGKYEAIVIDTVSEMEAYAIQHAVNSDYKGSKSAYSDFHRGDNNELPMYFSEFLRVLQDIETKFNIDILLICHSALGTEKNPMGQDYGKTLLDLKKRPTAKILKWLDYLGCVYEDVDLEEKGIVTKIKATKRVISFDNSSPFFDAKCIKQLSKPTVPFDIEGTWTKILKGGK